MSRIMLMIYKKIKIKYIKIKSKSNNNFKIYKIKKYN